MRKISKIKLNQLSKNELAKKQMNLLKGGSHCCCVCSNYGDAADFTCEAKGDSNALNDF